MKGNDTARAREIISLYIEGMSIGRIAEKLNRSSATTHDHRKAHNKAIERSGFCPSCRRVKSRFEGEVAVRN